ncbi:quinol monooxygenase YgiN [Bacillus fengqiuensis]|nr:quinol monooxygenase YgiN [Bacillus fengqiuensis]
MIIIHAYLKIDPTQRTEFLELAKQVMGPSQAEEGNISYDFYQNPEQPNQFVFVEKWKDHAAIQQHEETAHFKKFVSDVEQYLVEPLHAELFEASAL